MNIQKLASDPHAPYQKMYLTLFNAVTTALDLIEGSEVMEARSALINAQQATEELYISANE